MEERIWKVYQHIFPEGTCYIGITSRKLEERWQKDGRGYRKQKVYEIIK